jgi:hypothetical protein
MVVSLNSKIKRVLLTTAPKETLVERDGVGGNWYDRTDTYMAWTCAIDVADRLSVTCPPTGLHFIKANVPDVEILEYPTSRRRPSARASCSSRCRSSCRRCLVLKPSVSMQTAN